MNALQADLRAFVAQLEVFSPMKVNLMLCDSLCGILCSCYNIYAPTSQLGIE